MTWNGERLDRVSVRRLWLFSLCVVALVALICTIYGALLPPIVISCFVTYLLLPLVNAMERRHIPRTLAIAIMVLGTLGGLAFGLVRIVPLIYQQLVALIHLIPGVMSTLSLRWLPAIEQTVADLGFLSREEIHAMLTSDQLATRVASQLQGNLVALWQTGTSLFGGVLYVVLVPLLTFFMLKDYQHFAAGLKTLVPEDLRLPVNRIRARLDMTLRSVLKGQAIVAGILGVLYIVGLSIVGLESAIVIGLISGMCRMIPYLDVIVGGALSALVMVSYGTGAGQVVSVVAVFLVVQAIDGAVITPAIIGDRIGLHPLVVVLSVLALGDWMGFWGVLLAIPIAAVMKVLLTSLLPYYRASRAFQRGPR